MDPKTKDAPNQPTDNQLPPVEDQKADGELIVSHEVEQDSSEAPAAQPVNPEVSGVPEAPASQPGLEDVSTPSTPTTPEVPDVTSAPVSVQQPPIAANEPAQVTSRKSRFFVLVLVFIVAAAAVAGAIYAVTQL